MSNKRTDEHDVDLGIYAVSMSTYDPRNKRKGPEDEDRETRELVREIETSMNEMAIKTLWETVFAMLAPDNSDYERIIKQIVKEVREMTLASAESMLEQEECDEEEREENLKVLDGQIEEAAQRFIRMYMNNLTSLEYRQEARKEFLRGTQTSSE